MTNQILRRLERIEESMGARNDGPRIRIQGWFVSPETGEATAGPLLEVPPAAGSEGVNGRAS